MYRCYSKKMLLNSFHILLYIFLSLTNHFTSMADTTAENVTLPFLLFDHRIIINCSVNGHDLLLLFDTGASNSFLLPETIKQLELKQTGEDIVTRSNGSKSKSPIYISSKFNVGTIELNDTKILSSDLPFNLKCHGVKGFLGANVINSLNWKINFETKTIVVSKNILNSAIAGCKVKYIKNNPVLPITIEGEAFDFIIDFGYWGDLAMNFEILKRSIFSTRSSKALIKAQGIQNNQLVIIDKFYDYLLEEVSICEKVKVENVVLSGWNLPVSFIGMSFLQRFEIIINSSEASYIFIPRQAYSAKENPLLYNFGHKIEFDGKSLFASEFYSVSDQDAIKLYSNKIKSVDQYSVDDIRKQPCLFNDLLNHLSMKDLSKIVFESGAAASIKKEFVKFK